MVPIGKISRAFGIKGAVKIHLYNPDSDTLQPGMTVKLRRPKFERDLVIEDWGPGSSLFFEGISSRNDAELLRGAELLIDRSELPALDSDEVYLADLIDASVVDVEGNALGKLAGFFDTGAQLLAEVKTPDGALVAVPFLPPIVKKTDEKAGLIVLDPPLGLF